MSSSGFGSVRRAQDPRNPPPSEAIDTSTIEAAPRQGPVVSGRGGAGNYHSQPVELISQPVSKQLKPSSAGQSATGYQMTGRGGAGNSVDVARMKREAEQERAMEKSKGIQEEVARDVEALLTKPGKAMVHVKKNEKDLSSYKSER